MLATFAIVPLIALTACGSTQPVATRVTLKGQASGRQGTRHRRKPLTDLTEARKPCAGGGALGTVRQLGGISYPIGFGTFNLRNLWMGKRAGVYTNVYAGALQNSPRRGSVYLLEVDGIGPPTGGSGFYFAPVADGPLVITCVRRNLLSLRSRHRHYLFDLQNPQIILGDEGSFG